MAIPAFLTHPFTALISGPTRSGKSELVKRLIYTEYIDPPPEIIHFVSGEHTPLHDELKSKLGSRAKFHTGGWTSSIYDEFSPNVRSLLIIDDLMSEMKNSDMLSILFSRGSSKRNLSIILIVQNLYFCGKAAVDVRRNSDYVVLFRSKQDKRQIRCFAQQICPENSKFFMDAFTDATAEPYGYMLVDLTNHCPDEFMFRARLLEPEGMVIYAP